jgi:hypothetical protein
MSNSCWYVLVDKDWGQDAESVGPKRDDWQKRFYKLLEVERRADDDLKYIRRRAEKCGYKGEFVVRSVLRSVERAVFQELKRTGFPESVVTDSIHRNEQLLQQTREFLQCLPKRRHYAPPMLEASPLLRKEIEARKRAECLLKETKETIATDRELLGVMNQARDVESIFKLCLLVSFATEQLPIPYATVTRLLNIGLDAAGVPERFKFKWDSVNKMAVRFARRFPRIRYDCIQETYFEDLLEAIPLERLLGVAPEKIKFPIKLALPPVPVAR